MASVDSTSRNRAALSAPATAPDAERAEQQAVGQRSARDQMLRDQRHQRHERAGAEAEDGAAHEHGADDRRHRDIANARRHRDAERLARQQVRPVGGRQRASTVISAM